MPENRTDRTDFLGLLALMASTDGGGPSADAQGWGMPYWNQVQLDAQIAALHDAPRDGVALLTAPGTAPSCVVTNAGYLPAGGIYDVCQTWVDEYGRETNAGAVAEVDLGDPIADPVAAATISAVAEVEAGAGFDGGLIEVWYAWIDANAGETLPSPVVSTDIPYRAGGLQTEVTIELPSTPAAAGAAGANVYVRHRGGNVVLAAVLTDEEEDEVTLDGSWVSCFQGLPLANSTYASKSIEITGIAAPENAALTRFYIRPTGTEWTAGDRRLCLSSVDEWDPDTVSYPLLYTGASGQLIGGYPPTVSQVKAIRPIYLAEDEVLGILPAANLPAEAVLETELAKSIGEGVIAGLAVSAHSPADLGVSVATGEALIEAGCFTFAAATDLVIPAADGSNPRVDLICVADDGALEGPTENASLKGTPGATPTVPEPPAGYLVLAHIAVAASETEIEAAHITDARYLLPTVATLEGALASHEEDVQAHFTGDERSECLLSPLQKTGLTGGGITGLHTHVGLGSSGHPTAVGNLLELVPWLEDLAVTIRGILDARPQLWCDVISLAITVEELRAAAGGSSRRVFSDADQACAESGNTDFALDVVDEGLIVALSLTLSGDSPDIDFEIYRDAARTSLVKSWEGITATVSFREMLDWVNEESPQTGLAYCRVVNNTANSATVTTVITIKEV